MSVTSTSDVQYRRFNGYADPRYPEGMWWGSARSNGDASGGQNTITLRFAGAGVPKSSKLFSIGTLSIRSNEAVDRVAELFVSNFDGPTNEQLEHRMALVIASITNPSRNAVRARELTAFPLFLGAHRAQGTQALASVIVVNTTGVEYFFQAEGYWWGGRSIMADGGPQNPPQGIYRQ